MIIQIRIVIDVPKKDESRFSEVIEETTDFIIKQFPEYKVTLPRSPVVVTIDKFDKLVSGLK